jgi:hypothetical protein
MATLNARLASDEFVLLGENTVVRCGNVRLVRLSERDPSGPGVLDSLKSRLVALPAGSST